MWIPLESISMNTPGFPPQVKPGEVVSVSWLNRAAREALEASLPLLWVGGEISSLTRAASGHIYFTLKDADAQVRCTIWRNRAQMLPFRLEHGMRVEVRALVTLYEARGDYQLNVESVRRAGVGNLYEAFLRLKARLEAEGLFDPASKRPLPRFPRGLAIVTSPQAAAWHDVIAALARRAPHLSLYLYPAMVQGGEAPSRIAAAIALANRRATKDGTELLLLVRGGGSLEDLAAFNDESVARAIRASMLPVVVGVGHETDVTIADFAADLRAATPTAGAEIVSAGFVELQDTLHHLEARLKRGLFRRIETAAQRLDRAAMRLVHPRRKIEFNRLRLQSLAQRLTAHSQHRISTANARLENLAARLKASRPGLNARHAQVATLTHRLTRAAENLVGQRRQKIDALTQHLLHLDPTAVLARGYSITRDAAGHIVRDPSKLHIGDAISVELARGSVQAAIQSVKKR